jgi:hypothetical protein
VTADGPQMLVTEFEELARHADRSTEGARLEFINGHLGRKAVPDGDHGSIIEWLTRICTQQRPDRWLDSHQGLVVETYREGRARPGGSLVPSHAFAGVGRSVSDARSRCTAVRTRDGTRPCRRCPSARRSCCPSRSGSAGTPSR